MCTQQGVNTMKPACRLAGCIGVALSILVAAPAPAAEKDNYPNKPGRLILPFGAGASTDGHTLFTFGINQAITPGLYSKLPYHPLSDFTLISLYAEMPNILIATPSHPATTVAEFIKVAKANSGTF